MAVSLPYDELNLFNDDSFQAFLGESKSDWILSVDPIDRCL